MNFINCKYFQLAVIEAYSQMDELVENVKIDTTRNFEGITDIVIS